MSSRAEIRSQVSHLGRYEACSNVSEVTSSQKSSQTTGTSAEFTELDLLGLKQKSTAGGEDNN